MRQIFNLSFICIIVLGGSSCSSHKRYAAGRPTEGAEQKKHSHLSEQFGIKVTSADNISLYNTLSSWLGVRYRYGGNSKKGVDCSGLVKIVYKDVYGINTERTSANLFKKDCIALKRNKLREGDLVFFRTSKKSNRKTPTHVGIYLKNNKFVHASSSRGVIVSSLSEPYYVRTWLSAGRVKR